MNLPSDAMSVVPSAEEAIDHQARFSSRGTKVVGGASTPGTYRNVCPSLGVMLTVPVPPWMTRMMSPARRLLATGSVSMRSDALLAR